MNGVLGTALAFACRGHAVLPLWWPVGPDDNLVCACGRKPCGPNNRNAAKHPHKIAHNGFKSAATDIGVAKHWFGYLLPDANLGVRTDNLLVIDIDPRHGGDGSLEALIREHGEFTTWVALTGGGGRHIIFAAPEGVTLKSWSAEQYTRYGREPPLGVGIDVRSHGGYIVGVGSRHISGRRYEWSIDHHPNDVELAAPSDWLVERLIETTRSATRGDDGGHEPLSSKDWLKLLKPASEYPDDIARSIAGHLFAHGCKHQVVLALMRPWARENGLDQAKLERAVDYVAGEEAAKRKARLERDDQR